MRLPSFWRKISVRRTQATTPLRISAENTLPGSDRGELVGVAHHHEPRVRRQGAQQRVHEQDVDHRALVEDHGVAVEPVLFVFRKHDAVALLVELRPQQAVDRRGLPPRHLGHALGGAPGRRAEQGLQPELVEHGEDRADGGGLARAGPAGEHQQLMLQRKLQRLPLPRGVGDPLPDLQLLQELFGVEPVVVQAAAHGRKARGGVGLGLIELGQVAGAHARDLLIAELSVLDHRADAGVGLLALHADQLGGDRRELFARDEAVAVAGVVHQLEQDRRGDAVAAAAADAELEGHGVGLAEAAADQGAAQQIGVVPQQLERLVAVILVHAHGEHGAQAEGAHKLHQHPEPGLLPEARGDLLRPAEADPLDRGEPVGVVEDRIERLVAEAVDQQGRRRRPHALDRAAREEGVDRVGGGREQALGKLGLELAAVDAVAGPGPADDHGLARSGKGEAADDRHGLAAAVAQAEHRVAVGLVLVDDRLDGPGQLLKALFLVHYLPSLSSGRRKRPV